MGLFFTKPTLNVPAVQQVFREALETQPAANPEDDLQNAERLVTRMPQYVSNVPDFACRRVIYQALRTNLAGAQDHARSRNRYLVRKTYAFAKSVPYMDDQCEVDKTFYNFCRRHRGQRGERPAMRQGITDHVWSVAEVLGYRSAAPG